MNYVLAIYGRESSVTLSTWRFAASSEEEAIGLAATILGRFGWDSAALSTATGARLMVVTTGAGPMESHK